MKVGDRVTWLYGSNKPRPGVIVQVGSEAESLATDSLMGREPGESLRDYGLLYRILCDVRDCQCHSTEWLHACKGCQLTLVSEALPAPLEGMLL